MLTKIQLVADANVIDIPILDYNHDPYVLKAQTGLDPPDIDVFVADKVGHGGVYKGRRVPKRQVVLRVGMNPNYGVADPVGVLRDNLYSTLDTLTNGLIDIRLVDTVRPTITIQAIVEKFESPSSNQEVEVQITFICPQPFFTTLADVVSTPNTNTINVTYEGTASVGFVASISPLPSHLGNLVTITKTQTGESIRFTGDTNTTYIYMLDTREGSRSVKLSISGVVSNALHTLQTEYDWLRLTKGLNTFTVTSSSGAPTFSSFSYRPAYWGL